MALCRKVPPCCYPHQAWTRCLTRFVNLYPFEAHVIMSVVRLQAQGHVSHAESTLAQFLERERAVTFKGLPGSAAIKLVKVGNSGKRVIEVPIPLTTKVSIPPTYTIASQTSTVQRCAYAHACHES